MGKRRIYSIRNQSRQTKITMAKKKGVDLKKLMEAGALLAEARARGSSGGIASALQKSGIDLSGKDDGGTSKPISGASKGAKNINPWDEQFTEKMAGSKLTDKKVYEDMK